MARTAKALKGVVASVQLGKESLADNGQHDNVHVSIDTRDAQMLADADRLGLGALTVGEDLHTALAGKQG